MVLYGEDESKARDDTDVDWHLQKITASVSDCHWKILFVTRSKLTWSYVAYCLWEYIHRLRDLSNQTRKIMRSNPGMSVIEICRALPNSPWSFSHTVVECIESSGMKGGTLTWLWEQPSAFQATDTLTQIDLSLLTQNNDPSCDTFATYLQSKAFWWSLQWLDCNKSSSLHRKWNAAPRECMLRAHLHFTTEVHSRNTEESDKGVKTKRN